MGMLISMEDIILCLNNKITSIMGIGFFNFLFNFIVLNLFVLVCSLVLNYHFISKREVWVITYYSLFVLYFLFFIFFKEHLLIYLIRVLVIVLQLCILGRLFYFTLFIFIFIFKTFKDIYIHFSLSRFITAVLVINFSRFRFNAFFLLFNINVLIIFSIIFGCVITARVIHIFFDKTHVFYYLDGKLCVSCWSLRKYIIIIFSYNRFFFYRLIGFLLYEILYNIFFGETVVEIQGKKRVSVDKESRGIKEKSSITVKNFIIGAVIIVGRVRLIYYFWPARAIIGGSIGNNPGGNPPSNTGRSGGNSSSNSGGNPLSNPGRSGGNSSSNSGRSVDKIISTPTDKNITNRNLSSNMVKSNLLKIIRRFFNKYLLNRIWSHDSTHPAPCVSSRKRVENTTSVVPVLKRKVEDEFNSYKRFQKFLNEYKNELNSCFQYIVKILEIKNLENLFFSEVNEQCYNTICKSREDLSIQLSITKYKIYFSLKYIRDNFKDINFLTSSQFLNLSYEDKVGYLIKNSINMGENIISFIKFEDRFREYYLEIENNIDIKINTEIVKNLSVYKLHFSFIYIKYFYFMTIHINNTLRVIYLLKDISLDCDNYTLLENLLKQNLEILKSIVVEVEESTE